ncbi:MAG: glycoside hydrolase family 57 protein [Verrucomicrobiota bacterium]
MPLNVALLWHMHQPSYVDPVRGAALMPWVRLHATKGYLDMIWMVEQVPGFRCTFNITPVLIQQIEELAAGKVRDLWHELAATPADALTPEQQSAALEHFFKANHTHMIRPHARYWALLHKRGSQPSADGYAKIAGSFTPQDYRDLQAWFNLAWFGYAGDRLYPEIAALKRKGENFSEVDKQIIFDAQLDVLKNVLGYYRALAERGQIEITTTPFYHPILPLVHNTEFARRCLPGAKLPSQFSHPEDVRAQLILARQLHTKTFGVPPRGLWPSEGSVCPELIPVLQELGFEWFATDEEILWRSLAASDPGMTSDRNQLFQAYRVSFGGTNINAVFRERALSDFVGFTASRNEPAAAAAFMIEHFERIAQNGTGRGELLCAVVLDGENAWEHFPDGGEAFLRELYERIARHPDLHATTVHDYLVAQPPTATVPTLHTGSWINANFQIWIGHPEDNRGWELLGQTRAFLQSKISCGELTDDQQRRALDEIYAAEGSDWFWWYGDEFVTDNDLLFDELFRTHLQNVYNICGVPVPSVLKIHICRSEVVHEARQPTDLIQPVIDGQATSFYEWIGAGVYEAGRAMGAMYQAERLIDKIHFGFSTEQLFLRIDFRKDAELPPRASLRIQFLQPQIATLVIPVLTTGIAGGQLIVGESPPVVIPEIRYDTIVELALPFAKLDWQPRQQVAFFVQFLANEIDLERHPEVGSLTVALPDERFETENWRV